jgi:hypothetical protein
MMKSTDGGNTWIEIDAGKRPSVSVLEGTYQLQVGSTVYFSVSKGHQIWWLAFNTSDAAERPDQWVAAEMLDAWSSQSGQKQFSSLARSASGQFFVAYADQHDSGKFRVALNSSGAPASAPTARR